MRRLTVALSLLLFLPGLAPAAVAAIDARGERTTLPAPAERIIALAPHVTELLYAIGAGDRVVGVVSHSDFPPPARSLPRVGDAFRIDLERVLTLRPDLVVGWHGGGADAELARIAHFGIPVHAVGSDTLDAVAVAMEGLGDLTGRTEAARQAAQAYRRRLADLRRRYGGDAPRAVFLQLAGDPPMTAGRGHYLHELITLCSGRNVFADMDAGVFAVSREAVLAQTPAVIVAVAADGAGDPLASWRAWPQLPAVAQGRLHVLPADPLVRPGPRLADGAARLCRAINR